MPMQRGSNDMSEVAFQPRIIAFCCNWCSYAGADLAGVSRMQMPADFHVIRVMCSARVAPEWIIKALLDGIDGVMVLGCHIGDCHYISGNHRTAKRLELLQKMLSFVGVNPERVLLDWVSASEGSRFQRLVTVFVEQVRALGPHKPADGVRTAADVSLPSDTAVR